MNLNKQSLEDNLAEIKANLPEEFHADLEKSIADATTPVAPTAEEQNAAVAAELKANPDIEDKDIQAGTETFGAPAPLTEAETATAVQAELKNWEGK